MTQATLEITGQAIPGKGVILNNAEITDANVGLKLTVVF